MSKASITKSYDSLPILVRILLQIFLGAFISGIYRIIKFVETRNVLTLVVGILGLVTGVGNAILWIVDLVTLLTSGKVLFCAD